MKNKSKVLQAIGFLLLLACLGGLIGCEVPRQIIRAEGTEQITTNPCIFEYNGTVDEIYSMIKRELTMNLFITSLPDDRKSAVLVTDFKSLSTNESYNVKRFFKAVNRIHSNKQGDF